MSSEEFPDDLVQELHTLEMITKLIFLKLEFDYFKISTPYRTNDLCIVYRHNANIYQSVI